MTELIWWSYEFASLTSAAKHAGSVEYYYSQVEAWQISRQGEEIFFFKNGQKEIHRPNGTKDILAPDGRFTVTDATDVISISDGEIPKVLLQDCPREIFA